ncbi:MAG TPA: adenine phosphoribosyltransferase [Planctomycetota bacterium]|nr:adenine phosphoribosyltransferase [Planctomycetota bacterium]
MIKSARQTKNQPDSKIKAAIRTINDFPKKGIKFRDIAPLLADPALTKRMVALICAGFGKPGASGKTAVDKVVGIESRGFVIGAMAAQNLGVGFVMARKKGKLPGKVIAKEYGLEYGTACLELQRDCIKNGEAILIIDDVLATGGTVQAVTDMVRSQGGRVVGIRFLIDLTYVPKIAGLDLDSDVKSLIEL